MAKAAEAPSGTEPGYRIASLNGELEEGGIRIVHSYSGPGSSRRVLGVKRRSLDREAEGGKPSISSHIGHVDHRARARLTHAQIG